ncbi:MAG TPA: ABC transporter [Candidatus Pacebacteria bacterium]|nr:MAG: ABC-2 type transporter [Microgenomates group bacterium GW2011_GWB1_45_17]KKU23116.1 MAG: ABC-2 type transporter [Microgenomates group bacterium GW2011_GWA1_46_15]KKU23779.1 MAG: hypothetical protein UX36_C0003G0079 [Microgenomates group bacterium GW2011_GWC1_46_15]HAV15053.1 ABC transporter [Candidatus Paceibacterota bacterium]HCR11690.1 ABC transporter [Candidatus Paceibacterota bacterium]
MNIGRIWAVTIRHLYLFIHSLDRLTDMVYWPIMDIILWGFTTQYVQQRNVSLPHVALAILTALVFWQVVWRANYEISVNLLEEMWNANLVNMFSTPLKPLEWVSAVMLIGLLKMLITLGVGVGAVWFLYSLNIFTIGWLFLPCIALLMASGWFMGFLGSSFIIIGGTRVQTIAWTMGFLFAPFSAVFYPVSVLPVWAQMISRVLPTTYVFESMRTVLATGAIP